MKYQVNRGKICITNACNNRARVRIVNELLCSKKEMNK